MTDNQIRANRYLLQIRNADKELKELLLQIEYLRYKASGMGAIRYDKDHVQTSPEDMVCDAISEVVMLEGKLRGRHREIQDALTQTQKILQLLEDKYSTTIEVYYLNHGSMCDVARAIKRSDRTAYRIKEEALERFAQYIV